VLGVRGLSVGRFFAWNNFESLFSVLALFEFYFRIIVRGILKNQTEDEAYFKTDFCFTSKNM
jgi:hypothetical protein